MTSTDPADVHASSPASEIEARREVGERSCDAPATKDVRSEESASTRPDGSVRQAVRVRDGYVPPEEQQRYEAPRPQRYLGQCVDFNTERGYGFIRPDSLGRNLFVHHKWILEADGLMPGDAVEFERQPAPEGDRHDRAMNVRLLSRIRPPAKSKAANTGKAKFVPRAVAKRPASAAMAGGIKRTRPSDPEAGVLGLAPWM